MRFTITSKDEKGKEIGGFQRHIDDTPALRKYIIKEKWRRVLVHPGTIYLILIIGLAANATVKGTLAYILTLPALLIAVFAARNASNAYYVDEFTGDNTTVEQAVEITKELGKLVWQKINRNSTPTS